jgi:hypothetical protein
LVCKKKREDTNYLNKCQKDDRNLNSIVLRNFSNFVNNHPKIVKMVDQIIQNRELNISAETYCDLFRIHMPAKQSYVGVGKIKYFIDKEK